MIRLRRLAVIVVVPAIWVASGHAAQGQGRGQAPPPPAPPTAKAAAPIDLTGYWVSIITEDWRWRMVTPPKGDYASVPITPEAKKVADTWDPAKDEAAGEQCRSYGAAAIMRVPGRLHITWQDDNTLRVETDAGTQVRLLHFGTWKSPGGKPTWQGDSVAEWQLPGPVGGRGAGAGGENVVAAGAGAPASPTFGSLKVVTTRMRPGYLRKNGVPHTSEAVVTEHWDLYKEPNGDQWLVVTTIVDDPKYLQQPYITSPNFTKEPDGSKWDPTPCSARW